MEIKPISKHGFELLSAELKHLKEIDRPAILEAVAVARALGDLSENAEYSSAKERQRGIDKRISFLEDILGRARIVDIDTLSGDKIIFGAHVTAEDQEGNVLQCQLLSDVESDVNRGVIACTSPVGRAFIGKCIGDTCIVHTPSGSKEYEILEIKFKNKE